MRTFCLALGSIALIACGDPIVGDWEAEVNNTDFEISFESNGLGAADIRADGIDGKLYFDVEWEPDGDRYKVELDCTRSTVNGLPCEAFNGDADYECIIDDNDEL